MPQTWRMFGCRDTQNHSAVANNRRAGKARNHTHRTECSSASASSDGAKFRALKESPADTTKGGCAAATNGKPPTTVAPSHPRLIRREKRAALLAVVADPCWVEALNAPFAFAAVGLDRIGKIRHKSISFGLTANEHSNR